ncbi:hypothetical protein ROA7450_00231 [Roseovarius albus]|uniref:Uncharacterized protein n=1 Tax=Roseovarius albus TaxID=1247867 RepID=A0A1X6Y8C1_9RHOB|nr:hypothetical protein [Roseovarius albus]SLN13906.1 hypothetical protein ROA7450_00231 [Roseovarius albus]
MRMMLLPAFALFALPVSAETADERAARCEVQAGIIATSVEERKAGTDADKIKKSLRKGKNKVEKKYVPSVPYLVDFVFTLPEDQLTDEAASQFQKSCGAFEQ